MDTNYNSDHYVDPRQSYDRLSDKMKLGHLLYNSDTDKYIAVDLKVLEEILEFENNQIGTNKYLPIPINDLWLTLVFNFEKKVVRTHPGTFFTSGVHGFKIRKQGGRYMFGYTIREKGLGGSATFDFRPRFLYVHELMDVLFLMMREQFQWTEEDLNEINSIMVVE